MVRDGSYLIGNCAIITRLDEKIVYQSHIYKIRVLKNPLFDNYLLLALLASPFVQAQIKSQSFTQDIIDSLGKRIEDIIIPVPKSEELKKKISEKVKEIISNKIRSRNAMTEISNFLL